jgi:hypothetical protein
MPRAKRKLETSRSEHWFRLAVSDYTQMLNEKVRHAFGLAYEEQIEWLSPLRADDYAEYYDQDFLDCLGAHSPHVPLDRFWPSSGPRWDGLARTASKKYIMVEAKAYPAEAKTACRAKDGSSLALISASLEEAKRYFKADPDAVWQRPYYQYANRLAHLYFMRELNQLDAYLLFVNFADAPDVPSPCSEEKWVRESAAIERALGLPVGTKRQGVATMIWSVPSMLSGRA